MCRAMCFFWSSYAFREVYWDDAPTLAAGSKKNQPVHNTLSCKWNFIFNGHRSVTSCIFWIFCCWVQPLKTGEHGFLVLGNLVISIFSFFWPQFQKFEKCKMFDLMEIVSRNVKFFNVECICSFWISISIFCNFPQSASFLQLYTIFLSHWYWSPPESRQSPAGLQQNQF